MLFRSAILWAIVFGLLLSAHIAAMRDGPVNGLALQLRPGGGYSSAQSPTQGMYEMVNGVAAQFAEQAPEVNPNKPFRRGSCDEAARWLWFRVLTGEFKTRYEYQKGGDFAMAVVHAEAVRQHRRPSLFRQLEAARQFKRTATAEEIEKRLLDYSDFERETVANDTQAEVV